jgi:UDPglucose 6-dehydrogenase
MFSRVAFAKGAYDCIDGADAVVILTEWDEFRALNLAKVKRLLKSPVVVDLRNLYAPAQMKEHGLAYVSVGRGAVAAPVEPAKLLKAVV